MLDVLIDGRVLKHKYISGVERYAIEISSGLKEETNLKIDIATPSSNNRWAQHIWEHFVLSKMAKQSKVLFCPANMCPLIKPEGVRFITTVHDISFIDYPDSFDFSYRLYHKLSMKRILKNSDVIITVSNFSKKRILEQYPFLDNKIEVIYSGISSSFLSCDVVYDKKNYILYVGNLSRIKNFKGLAEAFEKVYKHINKKLIVIGINRSVMRFDKNIDDVVSKIPKDYIEFRGQVNNIDELVKLYKNASVFVFPSLHESFGFPVLEAMACGCPVVASNRGALPEICSDAALYVDPEDTKDIINKLLLINKDENVRNKCIKKGKERAKMFLWKTSIEKHRHLMLDLL